MLESMPWESPAFSYALILLCSALIGWGTNYIAIKMLFRPRRPLRLGPLRLHGLVPRRQKELAGRIAGTIEGHLLSHRDIEKALQSPEVEDEIARLVAEQIDAFIRSNLRKIPFLSNLVGSSLGAQIRELIIKELHTGAPLFADRLMNKFEEVFSLREIIQTKIEAFDAGRLEEIIYSISARELRTIEILGGVLGFLVGLMQVVIMRAGGF